MIILDTEKLPIKIWSNKEDLVGFDEAIDQAKALANHPVAREHVSLMPDFHVGYGMPIGGVMACEDAIIPNAVGVDIGCGMMALQTTIEASSITKDQLQALRGGIHTLVPVGNGPQGEHKYEQAIPPMPIDQGILNQTAFIEKAKHQMGTLGGGNHFIEIQKDPDDHVWIMLHSGSRGIGAAVCKYYDTVAVSLNDLWYSNVSRDKHGHNELAFLPLTTNHAVDYLADMQWCMEFAELNRHHMLGAVVAAFQKVLGQNINADDFIETHHNYANLEKHYGRQYYVHRKGAVKADQKVIIPGSMGTASYIADGLNERESFGSCSHGAGRVLGRKQANRTITHEQAVESMKHVVFGIREGDYEEMPDAYKPIEKVIASQLDLIKPLYRLEPMAVVKG